MLSTTSTRYCAKRFSAPFPALDADEEDSCLRRLSELSFNTGSLESTLENLADAMRCLGRRAVLVGGDEQLKLESAIQCMAGLIVSMAGSGRPADMRTYGSGHQRHGSRYLLKIMMLADLVKDDRIKHVHTPV